MFKKNHEVETTMESVMEQIRDTCLAEAGDAVSIADFCSAQDRAIKWQEMIEARHENEVKASLEAGKTGAEYFKAGCTVVTALINAFTNVHNTKTLTKANERNLAWELEGHVTTTETAKYGMKATNDAWADLCKRRA